MSFKFNPFTGLLDHSNDTAAFAEKVSDIFNCDSSVQVGDLVVASQTTENTVERITTNVYSGLVFGVVILKPSSITCEVLVSGKINGITGLTFGKPLFISVLGKLTTNVPNSGHSQKMGIAMTTTSAFLLPSMEKTILS